MKTTFEKINLSITTEKNSIPTTKAVAGRMRVSPDFGQASFVEESPSSMLGESKSRRVYCGCNCSVWYDPAKDIYKIRLQVKPTRDAIMLSECDYEMCANFIRRRVYGCN